MADPRRGRVLRKKKMGPGLLAPTPLRIIEGEVREPKMKKMLHDMKKEVDIRNKTKEGMGPSQKIRFAKVRGVGVRIGNRAAGNMRDYLQRRGISKELASEIVKNTSKNLQDGIPPKEAYLGAVKVHEKAVRRDVRKSHLLRQEEYVVERLRKAEEAKGSPLASSEKKGVRESSLEAYRKRHPAKKTE